MTKKELAQAVKEHCLNQLSPSERLDYLGKAWNWSSLAVALEYLGELEEHPDLQVFAASRGGVGISEYRHLIPEEYRTKIDLRSVLKLLPD